MEFEIFVIGALFGVFVMTIFLILKEMLEDVRQRNRYYSFLERQLRITLKNNDDEEDDEDDDWWSL